MGSALAYAIALIGYAKSFKDVIGAGIEIYAALENGYKTLKKMQDENRDPTVAEWDALNAHIEANMAKLDKLAGG